MILKSWVVRFFAFGMISLFSATIIAQPVIRLPPANDNKANALPIHALSTVVINDVEQATIEAGLDSHPCHPIAPNTGAKSVWFAFAVPDGTVTLDTTGTVYNSIGTTSVDSIITLYNISAGIVTCDDSGAGSGIITTTLNGGVYYAVVSAVAGVTVTLPSSVAMTISFVPSQFTAAYDSFENATKLKLPGNPTILRFGDGSVQPGEAVPSCAPEASDSHSYWFKFTLTHTRSIVTELAYGTLGQGVNGLYSDDYLFTLYRAPSAGLPQAGDEVACANLSLGAVDVPPGTYYLRISAAVAGGTGGAGATSYYVGVSSNSNFSFEVSNELADVNDPLLPPYKVKGSNGGDSVVCSLADVAGDCAFRFTHSAGENTTLQLKSNLTDLKVKKGDLLVSYLFYRTPIVPDATATLKIKYTDGTSSTHTFTFVQQPILEIFNMDTFPLTGKLESITLKVNDKSTVGTLEIDRVLLAIVRLGYAQRQALAAPSAGVLPVPSAP